MDRHNDNDLERRMRATFEPDAESVDRVVAGAMLPRTRRRLRLRAAAALALVGILVAFMILRLQPSCVSVESIRLEYVGNAALLEFRDGNSWVVSPDTADQGSQTHFNLILLEGD